MLGKWLETDRIGEGCTPLYILKGEAARIHMEITTETQVIQDNIACTHP